MKKIILYSVVFLVSSFASAQFEEQIGIKEAIDAAYDIRTAGVKLVKDYVYNNLSINFAYKEMDNSFSNSEDAMLILELYTKDKPEARNTLNLIKSLRNKNRMVFLRKPKKEQIAKMKEMLKRLSDLNSQLIDQIKASTSEKLVEEYELSRKIEVAIQESTLLHALKAMGDNSENIDTKIKIISQAIGILISKLMSSKNNNDKTTYYLKLLKSDFDMFVKTLGNNSYTEFLNTVYVLSNKIGNLSRKIANEYQK